MKKTSLHFLVLLFVFSCGKDFGDINVDPNNPDKVNPEFLLTGAQKLIAENVFTGFPNRREFAVAEYLAQSWTQNNYTDLSRYLIKGDITNDIFRVQYADILYDLRDIELSIYKHPGLDARQDSNKLAVARILRVYTFQLLTDLFGPIPYESSLMANKQRTPAYQSQRDIYLGIINELGHALEIIDESVPGFGHGDILYQGDMMKWRKFGRTLMMRIAMRISDVEPELARSEFEKSNQDGMQSVADNGNFRFLKSAPNHNPLYQQRLERGNVDQGLTSILIDKTLKPLNDPRLPIWAEVRINGGGYFGRPFGQSSETAADDVLDNYSHPSGSEEAINRGSNFRSYDVLRPDFECIFLSYAEHCFLMAEAAERSWGVTGSAEFWYHEGIRASMHEWGIMDAMVIENYLAQKEVNYNTAPGSWQQRIGVQKWLSFFMQGFQAWIEWRRLDFDKLEPPADGALEDLGNRAAPMRLVYPADEQTLNGAGYLKALDLLGGPDKLSSRVWWDVK